MPKFELVQPLPSQDSAASVNPSPDELTLALKQSDLELVPKEDTLKLTSQEENTPEQPTPFLGEDLALVPKEGDLELVPKEDDSKPVLLEKDAVEQPTHPLGEELALVSKKGDETRVPALEVPVPATDPVLETVPGDEKNKPSTLEQPVSPNLSSRWGEFSIATKNLLRGVYEKVKSSEPVQNTLNRLEAWSSGSMATGIEKRVKEAEVRQNQLMERSREFQRVVDTKQAQLDTHQETMTKLGIALEGNDVEQLQQEIEEARNEQQHYTEEAKKRGERTKSLREQQEVYQKTREEAARQVNEQLARKQEGNQAELNELQAKEKLLLSKKERLALELKQLQTTKDTFEAQIKAGAKGGLRKTLESSAQKVEEARGEKSREYYKVSGALEKIQGEIARLKKKNADWEAKKVKPLVSSRRAPSSPTTPEPQAV